MHITESYRNLEKRLLKEISEKSKTAAEQKETIKQWQSKYQGLHSDKEQMTSDREEETRELMKCIDEMSQRLR